MVFLVFICHLSKLTDFFTLFYFIFAASAWIPISLFINGLGGICPATKENEICHFGAVWT